MTGYTGYTGPDGVGATGMTGYTGYTGPGVETYVLYDSQTSGTNGGTFTSGAFQTRVLNTLVSNGGTNVALATNQFTLQPGDWGIIAVAPAHRVDAHQTQLYDITGAAAVVSGSSAEARNQNNAYVTESQVMYTFTIGSATTYELRHQGQTTRATDGFGLAVGFGVAEVYAQVYLTKFG
jgi:hypothetical protein